MNWKRVFIAMMTRGKYKQFIKDTEYPRQAQQRLWTEEILPLLRQSSYWSPLSLDKSSLKDFSITSYTDYEEGLSIAQNNTIQPFNGEEIIFWSETSGTAGVRKFFPITKSFQMQFQRTMPPFIHCLTQRFSGFFKEKIVYLVAVDVNKKTPAGTPAGWISNFNYRHLPPFIKKLYAMPNEVFADTETFNQWGPLYALASDLSAFFAVTPMVIDAFYDRCVSGLQEYLPYLSGEKSLPSPLPTVKVSASRLRYLQSIANKPDIKARDLWPSLAFIGCWTSGLCESAAKQLQQRMGQDIPFVDSTYSATEGWLTVPLNNDSLGGVLHPGAHVVEFIEEELEIIPANLIPCWKLVPGKKYEVFLTTAMGFVRYRLKDIVKCTGYFNQAPIIEFCYKSQMLSLEGCAITGQELQSMLSLAGLSMAPYWYFARNRSGNRIVLVINDTTHLSDEVINRLHQQLMTISPAYAHHIKAGAILPITLLKVPLAELLADTHGQTKPTLISTKVLPI